MLDQPFADAHDVTSIATRLHPIDVGFDLRRQDMLVVVECVDGADLRVSYADKRGARMVASGPYREVIARLRHVGYHVQPIIHWRTTEGVYGYEPGDVLVNERSERLRAVKTGKGVELAPDNASHIRRAHMRRDHMRRDRATRK